MTEDMKMKDSEAILQQAVIYKDALDDIENNRGDLNREVASGIIGGLLAFFEQRREEINAEVSLLNQKLFAAEIENRRLGDLLKVPDDSEDE